MVEWQDNNGANDENYDYLDGKERGEMKELVAILLLEELEASDHAMVDLWWWWEVDVRGCVGSVWGDFFGSEIEIGQLLIEIGPSKNLNRSLMSNYDSNKGPIIEERWSNLPTQILFSICNQLWINVHAFQDERQNRDSCFIVSNTQSWTVWLWAVSCSPKS